MCAKPSTRAHPIVLIATGALLLNVLAWTVYALVRAL